MHIKSEVTGGLRGNPDKGGNVFLHIGGGVIRHAVQEEAVFAKRFAMVGSVNQNGVVFISQGFENIDGLLQKDVAVVNRIVIGVNQLLRRTEVKLGRRSRSCGADRCRGNLPLAVLYDDLQHL